MDLYDFLEPIIELSTDSFVSGVKTDYLTVLLLLILKALPPPADKTAEAESRCEISDLI